jgi:acyl-coenzyme A thioesterase PaaI-like protein
MSEEKRVTIKKLQGHNCFACGTANPIGLNLQFYRFGDAVYSDITLGKNHEGWENVAHGGIVSTLLDEVMSWSI